MPGQVPKSVFSSSLAQSNCFHSIPRIFRRPARRILSPARRSLTATVARKTSWAVHKSCVLAGTNPKKAGSTFWKSVWNAMTERSIPRRKFYFFARCRFRLLACPVERCRALSSVVERCRASSRVVARGRALSSESSIFRSGSHVAGYSK